MQCTYTYLKVTFGCEISSPDQRTIEEWAQNATTLAQQTPFFPYQQKPTLQMISNWKRALSKSLLRGDSTIDNPAGPMNLVLPEQPPSTFTEFLQTRPQELRVMGTQVLNNNEALLHLANRLKNGNMIQTFGNGAVKDGIGAHRWHIHPSLARSHIRRSSCDRISSSIRRTPRYYDITQNGKHSPPCNSVFPQSSMPLLWNYPIPLIYTTPLRQSRSHPTTKRIG